MNHRQAKASRAPTGNKHQHQHQHHPPAEHNTVPATVPVDHHVQDKHHETHSVNPRTHLRFAHPTPPRGRRVYPRHRKVKVNPEVQVPVVENAPAAAQNTPYKSQPARTSTVSSPSHTGSFTNSNSSSSSSHQATNAASSNAARVAFVTPAHASSASSAYAMQHTDAAGNPVELNAHQQPQNNSPCKNMPSAAGQTKPAATMVNISTNTAAPQMHACNVMPIKTPSNSPNSSKNSGSIAHVTYSPNGEILVSTSPNVAQSNKNSPNVAQIKKMGNSDCDNYTNSSGSNHSPRNEEHMVNNNGTNSVNSNVQSSAPSTSSDNPSVTALTNDMDNMVIKNQNHAKQSDDQESNRRSSLSQKTESSHVSSAKASSSYGSKMAAVRASAMGIEAVSNANHEANFNQSNNGRFGTFPAMNVDNNQPNSNNNHFNNANYRSNIAANNGAIQHDVDPNTSIFRDPALGVNAPAMPPTSIAGHPLANVRMNIPPALHIPPVTEAPAPIPTPAPVSAPPGYSNTGGTVIEEGANELTVDIKQMNDLTNKVLKPKDEKVRARPLICQDITNSNADTLRISRLPKGVTYDRLHSMVEPFGEVEELSWSESDPYVCDVTYRDASAAHEAKHFLNDAIVGNDSDAAIKAELKSRDPGAQLFVGDLTPDVTEEMLEAAFSQLVGENVSALLKRDPDSMSPIGYGFLSFQNESSANFALVAGHRMNIGNACVRVGRAERNTYLYVSDLPGNTSMNDVRDIFDKFGALVEEDTLIIKRSYAFVRYKNRGSAEKAKRTLDKTDALNGKISVRYAEAEPLKACVAVQFHSSVPRPPNSLKDLVLATFSKYGNCSVEIPRFLNGMWRKVAFVTFHGEPISAHLAALEAVQSVRFVSSLPVCCQFAREMIPRMPARGLLGEKMSGGVTERAGTGYTGEVGPYGQLNQPNHHMAQHFNQGAQQQFAPRHYPAQRRSFNNAVPRKQDAMPMPMRPMNMAQRMYSDKDNSMAMADNTNNEPEQQQVVEDKENGGDNGVNAPQNNEEKDASQTHKQQGQSQGQGNFVPIYVPITAIQHPHHHPHAHHDLMAAPQSMMGDYHAAGYPAHPQTWANRMMMSTPTPMMPAPMNSFIPAPPQPRRW